MLTWIIMSSLFLINCPVDVDFNWFYHNPTDNVVVCNFVWKDSDVIIAHEIWHIFAKYYREEYKSSEEFARAFAYYFTEKYNYIAIHWGDIDYNILFKIMDRFDWISFWKLLLKYPRLQTYFNNIITKGNLTDYYHIFPWLESMIR
jgi:hypothetical protein